MFIVTMPNVVESFHRALNEVLVPWLSTGNSAVLMGNIPVMFYKCDLLYNNDFFRDEKPHANPFICFVGERAAAGLRTEKCRDPNNLWPCIYETRQQIFRTVFVGIGRSLQFNPPPYEEPGVPRVANMRDAELIWSQLLLVMENKWKNFNDRGIYKPILPSIPAQIQHKDYFLLSGQLSLEIRFTLSRGN